MNDRCRDCSRYHHPEWKTDLCVLGAVPLTVRGKDPACKWFERVRTVETGFRAWMRKVLR